MKRTVFLLLAILEIVAVYGQNGIRFEDESVSFDKILQKAKNENKIIFIDCYTSWCGPCKWMAKNVFTNDTVGDFFNSHFICAKMDMKKGEGPEIGKRFEIQCYPTYIFIDGNGKLLHRKSSSCGVQEFVEIGQDALIPEKRFSFFKEKYDAGSISRQELVSYMKLRKASYLDTKEQRKKYFSTQTEADYLNETNWIVMRDFGVELHSPEFEFLLSNRDTFCLLHTADSTDKVIKNSYLEGMRKTYWGEKVDTLAYVNLKLEVINLRLPFSNDFVSFSDAEFHRRLRYLEWCAKKKQRKQ
jgi:thiol-disulfide isomerase/thioredoxin